MVKFADDGKWYRVSLRLMGDTLNLDEITSKLNIEPTTASKKGDLTRFGEKTKTNIWGWRYPALSDVPFETQIDGLLKEIESRKSILRDLISPPEVKGELFLGHGSVSDEKAEVLSAQLLRRIAEFGLTVDLDLY